MNNTLCKSINIFFMIKLLNDYDNNECLKCIMLLIIIYAFSNIENSFAVNDNNKHN